MNLACQLSCVGLEKLRLISSAFQTVLVQGTMQSSDLLALTLVCFLGFQVYQLDTGHYLCRNKYYGRGLSIEGFRNALYQYLHNGLDLRRDLFEPILV